MNVQPNTHVYMLYCICLECEELHSNDGLQVDCTTTGDMEECHLHCLDGRVSFTPIPDQLVCGRLTNYMWSHQLVVAHNMLPQCTGKIIHYSINSMHIYVSLYTTHMI